MAIEIVDVPINSMVIFHSYVSLPEGNQGDDLNHSLGPWSRPGPGLDRVEWTQGAGDFLRMLDHFDSPPRCTRPGNLT